jgi:colanic acid/amylovoran biosynthesis glycosyltransferase
MDPFPELSSRPTVLHVRSHTFSNRAAPFIRQTVLGLRPYVNNIVLARDVDCANPPDVAIEMAPVPQLRHRSACARMASELRAKYPNIDLVMGHMGNGTRIARNLAEALGVPLLGSFGGSDVNVEFPKQRYRAEHAELLAMPAAQFLTVAGYLRDKLIGHGAPADRLFVWHRGVDVERFAVAERARATARKVRLVMSARFYEVKGHAYAIRALATVIRQRHRAELLLLGDGPLQDQMKALVTELGIGDHVHFLGHLTHDDVGRYLHSADVYIHPSVTCEEGRVEGIPNAIMEAHATGLPIVATRHGGIAEAVIDGRTGFLVPERDADRLAERIAELIDDRELRTTMGMSGRAHVEREFNLAIQSRRLAARIGHTIAIGELFDLRGWSKYSAHGRPPVEDGPSTRSVFDPDKLLNALRRPRFVARRRIVGPVVALYKRAVWTAVFRPFLRLITRELAMFVGDGVSAQQPRTPAPPDSVGARRRRTHSVDATELRMSSAACLDCPHTPVGEPWPDRACPLDRRCLETLQREFSLPVVTAASMPIATALTLADGDLGSTGRLDHPDASHDSMSFSGDLQSVRDVSAFLREARRILRPGGELHLALWPLPRGRDGARLLGGLMVPFAQHLFSREVIEEYLGSVLRPPRQFGADDVIRWAADLGLSLQREQRPVRHEDPCEMQVQARFGPALRRTGLRRRELARSFVATFQVAATSMAAADTSALATDAPAEVPRASGEH